MNAILAAATEIQALCESRAWRFCFIGGLAVQRWGEPSLTQGADLTIITGFGNEGPYIDSILSQFASRRADGRDFALRHRVALVRSSTGVPIDISFGAMPFEERAVERSSGFDIAGDASIRTCGAEDLIVMKAFAGRERDWVDIEGIALRQAGRLDANQIQWELEPLLELKEDTETGPRLHAMLDAGGTSPT